MQPQGQQPVGYYQVPQTGAHRAPPPTQQQQQVQYVGGQPVLMQTVPIKQSGPKTWANYNASCSIRLGVIQIIAGLIFFVFNIIGLAILDVKYAFSAFYLGHGFWCGIFFLMAGGFAVGAGQRKTTCMIVTSMVMSILAAVLDIGGITCTAIGTGISSSYYRQHWAEGADTFGYSSYGYAYDIHFTPYEGSKGTYPGRIALNSMMLIAALVEMVVAIWTSALACNAVCCGRRQPNEQTAMIQQQAPPGGQPSMQQPQMYPAPYPAQQAPLGAYPAVNPYQQAQGLPPPPQAAMYPPAQGPYPPGQMQYAPGPGQYPPGQYAPGQYAPEQYAPAENPQFQATASAPPAYSEVVESGPPEKSGFP